MRMSDRAPGVKAAHDQELARVREWLDYLTAMTRRLIAKFGPDQAVANMTTFLANSQSARTMIDDLAPSQPETGYSLLLALALQRVVELEQDGGPSEVSPDET